VFSVAGDGGFALESMNRAAEAVTGRSRFAVRGWTPDELARAEGRALKRAMLEAVSSGEPANLQIAIAPEAAARPVPLTVTAMRHGSGETRRVLVRAPQRTAAPRKPKPRAA